MASGKPPKGLSKRGFRETIPGCVNCSRDPVQAPASASPLGPSAARGTPAGHGHRGGFRVCFRVWPRIAPAGAGGCPGVPRCSAGRTHSPSAWSRSMPSVRRCHTMPVGLPSRRRQGKMAPAGALELADAAPMRRRSSNLDRDITRCIGRRARQHGGALSPGHDPAVAIGVRGQPRQRKVEPVQGRWPMGPLEPACTCVNVCPSAQSVTWRVRNTSCSSTAVLAWIHSTLTRCSKRCARPLTIPTTMGARPDRVDA
jgi:hypothetical protein